MAIDFLGARQKTLADEMLEPVADAFQVDFLNRKIPLYRLVEWLAFIVDKNGNTVNFRYNRQQCLLYLKMAEMRKRGRQVRINILKARQIGFSTMIAVQSCIYALFTPNVKVGILADTKEHASALFEKINFVYSHLDVNNPWRFESRVGKDGEERLVELPSIPAGRSFKPRLLYCRGKSMLQTAANSAVEIMAVGDNAGRASHYTILHCSECAFWKDMQKAFVSLFQTVSRTDPNSMIFLETTANGYNDYKQRWDSDSAGESSFEAFFAPWWGNPGYSVPVGEFEDVESMLEPWELRKMRLHKLTPGQMKWYHEGFCDLGRNKDAMLQENPFDPADAFISTSSTVFDKDILAKRKDELYAASRARESYKEGIFECRYEYSPDGMSISIDRDSIRFREYPHGPIRIFEAPRPGYPYVASCDPNEGGADDCAIQVIDNVDCHQAARLKSNELSNFEAAIQEYCLGIYYNGALLSSENNRGKMVLDALIKTGYPNLYVSQADQTDDYARKAKRSFGHRVGPNNRQAMVETLALYFKSTGGEMIRDYDTILEMESFQNVVDASGRAKPQATGGAHDDLVMALCGALYVRSQMRATPEKSEPTSRFAVPNNPADVSWRLMLNRREQEESKRERHEAYNRSVGIRW